MKKTLALSMMLCGSVSLLLAGCSKDDASGDDTTTAATTTSNTTGDGDETGSGGDGDGDASTTDASTSGVTTGGGFVPEEDFQAASECDPFLQDCPEGEKCVPYGSTGGNWDANKCVAVTGDGAPGDQCTYGGTVEATDDCGPTSHCWDVQDVDGALVGTCTEFCGGTADAPTCPGGTSCLIANDGSINLCIQTCDPLLQDCGDGLACFWANTDFQCIFTTQDIPTGEPCGFINDCAAGNICLSADVMPNCNGASCCGSYCDLGDPSCPQMGTECSAFFEEGMAPPGFETVGVCILPGA